ncbi:MAG: hypothetical protein HY922_17790 [Elusimicrobia bacterium]|nr:hypothetical protein [Elusimicrobiota bacterium]
MRDREAFLGLALLAGLLLGPSLLAGRCFFWGDLTYLNHPWRALSAQLLQSGELPLWNRYAYLGMPLAAQMQCAAWYPLTIQFYIFSFPTGLGIFHAAHCFLAGFFAYLWLRRCALARAASFAGAAALALCGGMVSRLSFLNHLSTLAWLPAFLLFAHRPFPLALALAAAILSGYPPMLAGAAACAAVLSAAWRTRACGSASCARHLAVWGAAAGLAAALAACLLIPGLELAAGSRRSGGIASGESLLWSFRPADFLQLLSPAAVPAEEFSPAIFWWKTAYFGFLAWGAALAGLFACGWRGASFAGLYSAGAALLMLGGSNPLSLWLWNRLPPLHYIRYPGNMAYLLIPLVIWLVAKGLDRRRGAWLASFLIAGELLFYASSAQPTIERSYYAQAGPLVEALRRNLGGHRYLMSPQALHWQRGHGGEAEQALSDLKQRLYGLANMPYRLESVGNFGEPLVPGPQYDFMDFLYRRSGLDDLAPWLPWADARIVLTRERLPSRRLKRLGESLWQIYRSGESSRAYWLDEKAGGDLPTQAGAQAPDSRAARPLELLWRKEDAFRVEVDSERPGWLYVAEPLGPGWQVRAGLEPLSPVPALTAFAKLRLPAGRSSVDFVYRPGSWRFGMSVTLLFLCALAAYWYNRWKRRFEEFQGPATAR